MSEAANPDLVRTSSLGDELTKQECEHLAAIMGVRQLADGELLSPEGGKDSTLFLLAKGRLAVSSNIEGADREVYVMTQGECAGTRAFVDRSPRKASLRAEGNVTVYTLEPDAFEALLDTEPRVVYKVMRALFRITHANLMRMNLESRELANYITKSHGRY